VHATSLLFLPWLLMAAPLSAQQPDVGFDPQYYLQQTDLALRDGRLTQAGQMIGWLEQNADGVLLDDITLLRAEFAIAQENVAGAAAALLAIKDHARNLCRLETAKGWVAANRNAIDDAIVALAKATRNCPDDSGAWNLLGLAFVRKGEAEAALEAFEHALLLSPDQGEIRSNHALALLQKGQLELAAEQLEAAAKQAPENHLIRANLDFVWGMMGATPDRRAQDSDAIWSARLVNFARGAKAASRTAKADALFSQALLTLDRFDETVWAEITTPEEARN
jgi:Flp pilus assembly protein TadD